MGSRLLHERAGRRPLIKRPLRYLAGLLVCVVALMPSMAAADPNHQVQISGLTDLAFGSISNLAADDVLSENVCVYAKNKPTDLYTVTASGSGTGGAFTLSSGSATLAYDVQWSASPNSSSGTQLIPNQALTGQQNGASNNDCSQGPPATATLIVILRAASLSSAFTGTYQGTLTLLVAPQ